MRMHRVLAGLGGFGATARGIVGSRFFDALIVTLILLTGILLGLEAQVAL